MADELSFEDFAGGTPSPQASSSLGSGEKPLALLTADEFEGTPDSPYSQAFNTSVKSLKAMGGEAAALLDMGLSMPGFLINVGAQLGGTIQAKARGVPFQADPRMLNPVTAYGVGREAGHTFSEPFMNPLKRVLDLFKSGKAYEESKTSAGMEKLMSLVEEAGLWAERSSGGRISRDSVPMLTESLMAAATGIGSGRKGSGIDPQMAKRMRASAEKLRNEAEAAAKANELSPEEFAARAPVQDQINSMLGIRTPAEQAKITRERRKQAKQGFNNPEEGGDYGSAAESQFRAEERLQNETNLNQANILDTLQRTPEERTANDIAMLRLGQEAQVARAERAKDKSGRVADELAGDPVAMEEAMRIAQKEPEVRTREENTALRRWAGQRGAMTNDAAMLLSAAGIGGVAGSLLDDNALRGALLGGATATAPLTMMRGPGKVSKYGTFGQEGAVKGPGGMWHPEVVERLAYPLAARLTERFRDNIDIEWLGDTAAVAEFDKQARPFEEWSNKAVKNYLNKYAGTERDPLSSIEMPDGGTWGELLDLGIKKDVFQGAGRVGDLEVRPGEAVFNLVHIHDALLQGGRVPRESYRAVEAVSSYLSHVGDYLRQNVIKAPEQVYEDLSGAKKVELEARYKKDGGRGSIPRSDNFMTWFEKQAESNPLNQYDLVRAARETAANDAKMAKQMEKAQGDSTKSLPVYKAYPAGFKWVELKLPEKLTEEQAKQVRPLKKGERAEYGEEPPMDAANWEETKGAHKTGYIALGPDGKSLKNAYTGDVAWGKTPEEAWLAGRLAEEGNTMGHCVGGYCESVARGDSKIYSLRDPKGKSHVTIEVSLPDKWVSGDRLKQLGPEGEAAWKAYIDAGYPADMHEFVKKNFPEVWNNVDPEAGDPQISQIKGKQNRAPNKEYLPYVQDFVREGKWGEVQDLHNTDLHDTGPSRKNSQAYNKLAEEFHPGQRYITKEDFNKLQAEGMRRTREVGRPRGREEGKVSQEMVAGLSAIGLGGVLGSLLADDAGEGALLGALAGGALMLPGTRARLADAAKAADWGLGALSTRIGNISEAVKLRGRDYERRVLEQAHIHLDKVVPFFKELNKLGKTQRAELDRAILTNDREAIAALIKSNTPLVAAWRNTQNVLHDLGEKLQGHGRFKTMLDDYFPRLVKDVEGLKAALGGAERTHLEEALIAGEKAALKNRGTPLTLVEQSSIINREIQGFRRAKGYQPGYAKGRKVDEITEKLQPFYHTPEQSLYAYVRGAVQDLELARFFGRDLAQTRIGSQNHINVETSIGNLVGRELNEKRITPAEAQELGKMLQSRFQGGERASSRLTQEVRNLGNLGLLGNVVSAVTQLGDVATAIYAQGLRSSLTALVRQVSGNKKVSTKDFGLADHIAEEFVSPTKTAQWLNSAFKWAGFTAIDRFGKNTNLNAALDRAQRLSRTNEGISQLSTKYGEAFGTEFPSLVSDLKAGRITERVRSLLFSELSDVQPISKMELPQGYLENPNGRIAYMLKTFMLKQIDMMRRDVYNEAKAGNIGKALRNGTGYALVLGLAGATTDMIKSWMLGRDPHFEATDVAENVLKTFGMGAYVRDKIAAGKPIEALAGLAVPPYRMMDDIIRRDPKAVRYIPIVGQLYYSWELGGKEANEIAKKKKTKEPLSPEAKQYRREQREKRRAQQ